MHLIKGIVCLTPKKVGASALLLRFIFSYKISSGDPQKTLTISHPILSIFAYFPLSLTLLSVSISLLLLLDVTFLPMSFSLFFLYMIFTVSVLLFSFSFYLPYNSPPLLFFLLRHGGHILQYSWRGGGKNLTFPALSLWT